MSKKQHHFKELQGKKKIEYLIDYYKFHFIIGFLFICILCYSLHGCFIKKDNILYIAFANVASPNTSATDLQTNFLNAMNLNTKSNQLYFYENLLLTKNPSDDQTQYAYLSETKLLAGITSKQLDVVIMDKQALDILVEENYLSDLTTYSSSLTVDKKSPYAIGLPNSLFFQSTDESKDIYIGFIGNSERINGAIKFLQFLQKEGL